MHWPASRIAPPTPASAFDVIKIVSLFLIGMLVLAMFGRLRFPGRDRLRSMKCDGCGRYRMGKGPCPCGKG